MFAVDNDKKDEADPTGATKTTGARLAWSAVVLTVLAGALPLLLWRTRARIRPWLPAAVAAPAGSVRAAQVIVIEGRREAREAAVSADSIRYLPFDVPPGVTRIHVKKEFDHGPDPNARNTVDLGLFDPRGYAFGGPGFRGWQGGMPDDLVLSGDMADSPYYLAGPIPAGRWHLAQWFIKSTRAGLGYKYIITLSFDGAPPPARMPAVPRYQPGVLNPAPGWYAGNLHAHSRHSDGTRTLAEVVARNKAAGFHFLAATDHNTPRHHYEFAATAQQHPDHLLLFGDEFTSPFGHANIIGQRPGHWFDFRINGGDGRLPQIIAQAHRQGAIFMINHPFTGCTTCLWRYPFAEAQSADAIEVWNGTWNEDDRLAVEWWDRLLKQGRRIHALGGSDYHRGDDPLMPATWVYARNLSQPAVMEAMRRGRAFLAESPHGVKLYLSAQNGRALPGDSIRLYSGDAVAVQVRVTGGQGLTLRLVSCGGEAQRPIASADAVLNLSVPLKSRVANERKTASAAAADARRTALPAPASGCYVRAELRRPDGAMAALTNPIYITVERGAK